MRHKINKLTLTSVLIALALALAIAENLAIPLLRMPIPGAKIGLSNIAVLVAFYFVGPWYAFVVLMVRVFVVFLFGGNTVAFVFSLFGGVMAYITMFALKHSKRFSLYGISAGGAFAHASGQMVAAVYLTGSTTVFYYMPILTGLSLVAGLVVALLAVPIFKALVKYEGSHFYNI